MKAIEGGTRKVAKQKRKPAQQAPITANPLFPAVVALWFGALFGLGSLAVRPSLIEDLVLSSRIDLVIPAAAPPLGMTARIMLALVMAVIGAVIGVMLARRLTRPKPEHRERSRGVGGKKASPVNNRARDAHPDAPSCQPISMRDIDPDGAERGENNAVVGRRRGLTADHAQEQFVPHEFAPLPGGGEPQILDLARGGPPMVAPLSPAVVESGLVAAASQVPAENPVPPAFQPAAETVAAQMPFAPPAQPTVPVEAMAVQQVPIQPAPIQQAAIQPVPAAATPMQFQPPLAQPNPVPAAPALAPETAAAHADGRQVFGMQPAEPQPEKPRQIFGQAVEGDHVPQDFIREAGYRTTVFEQEEPAPLFNRQAQPVAPVAEAAPPMAPATVPAAMPQAYEPPPAAPVPAADPLELTAMVVETVPAAALAPAAEPAPAAPLPSPAGLEMTDLATRLAESMRRRRAAKAGVPVAEAAPAPLPEPVAFEAPQAAAIPAVIPEAYTPPAPAFEAAAAPEPAPVPQAFVAPEPAPVPQAFVAPDSAPIPQAFVAPEPAPVPQAFVAPEPAPVPQAFVPEAVPQPTAFAAPAQAAGLELPSALRPLALDAFLEDDGQFDRSLLPPRHIAMPTPPAQAAPVAAPADAFAPIPAAAPDNVPGEEAVVEENYASLLGIGQSRAGFVRIEEPEPDLSDPEPVVIFPGQAPIGQAAPAAAPAPFGANDGGAFRRFDSPASAGAGQPVDLGAAPPAVPATEAEQALRSALASLQRISGAA